MHPYESYQSLIERLRSSENLDSPRLRNDVESSLRPMIRCALRSGVGHPNLVEWVRSSLPGCDSPELRAAVPEGFVPHLAHNLCTHLLQHYRRKRLRSQETVRVAC